jgi:hypothetical protein
MPYEELCCGVFTLLKKPIENFIVFSMQRTGRFQHPQRSSDLDTEPSFNVVIAYEDFETGKNARRTYDYLAHHLGRECRFNNEMWKFDVLGIPKLRELAVRDVRTADLIIISCHGGSPLPNQVKSWIELWLTEEVSTIALVALFDSPVDASPETRKALDYLADVAKRGNLEFFAQPDHWPGRHELLPVIQLSPARDSAPNHHTSTSSALPGFSHRVEIFPHWGINE